MGGPLIYRQGEMMLKNYAVRYLLVFSFLLVRSLPALAVKLPSELLKELMDQTDDKSLLTELVISKGSAKSESDLFAQFLREERNLKSVHNWLRRSSSLIDLEVGVIEGRIPYLPSPIIFLSQNGLMQSRAIASQSEAQNFHTIDLLETLSCIPKAKLIRNQIYSLVKLNYILVQSIAEGIRGLRPRNTVSRIYDWWYGEFFKPFLERVDQNLELYTKKYLDDSFLLAEEAIEAMRLRYSQIGEPRSGNDEISGVLLERAPHRGDEDVEFLNDPGFL